MNIGQRDAGITSSDWVRVPDYVAYRQIRQNVAELLRRHCEGGRPVAACPGWTVRDLLAHLVSVCRRVVAASDGGAPDPRPVEAIDVVGLLSEWAAVGERMDQILADSSPRRGGVAVMDAFTHEFDLRHALGVSLPLEHPAYPGAFDVVVSGYSAAVRERGLPALRIETDVASWVAGEGSPAAAVRAHRHDLYRSLAGRRTREQITRLSWSEDPDRWLPAFAWGPFTPPDRPVEDLVVES